jgi:hypothetical protein
VQILPAGSVTGPSLTTTSDTNTGIYFPGADRMAFTTGGVIRGSWTTDGLCFGTDTSAVNALRDYEEGNWTPAWAFSTSGSVTTSLAFGRYTKIGNTVFIRMRIGTTALSSPTGDITITGLPFASTNEANTSNRASLAVGEAYRWTTDMPNIKAQILDNSLSIAIYKAATNSTSLTAVQGSDMSAGSNFNALNISGCYHTAS